MGCSLLSITEVFYFLISALIGLKSKKKAQNIIYDQNWAQKRNDFIDQNQIMELAKTVKEIQVKTDVYLKEILTKLEDSDKKIKRLERKVFER